MQDPQNALRSLVANQAAANVSAANPADVSLVPPQLPPRSPTTTSAPAATAATTTKQTTKSDSNPWGMESELDRRVGRLKQIKDDEELARKLQQEEKDHRKRDKKQSFWHRHQNDPKNAKPDPFTSLDGTPNGGGGSSSGGHHQRTGSSAANGHKQPLNLASGSSRKKANKNQISVVDPSQLRTAQQKLSGRTSPLGSSSAISREQSAAAVGRGPITIDQAFSLPGSTGSPRSPSFQQQQQAVFDPPPRARPTTRQQQQQHQRNQSQSNAFNAASLVGVADAAFRSIPASPLNNTGSSGFSELTTNRMAAATASGNTAQIDQLERMAKAREQELAAQEARIRQQQEEMRKQAAFLQQQQQHLLQMQQSQKVEAQLKQLKEEKDRFEQQRQAEELKKQVDLLRSQQQQ
ncbi:hypothetical protein GGH99_008492, partial [Coemansia sp. RSA 1285]